MAGLAARALARVGRDVTLRNFSSTSEDDYGPNRDSTTETTVKGRVDRRTPTEDDIDRTALAQGEVANIVDVYLDAADSAVQNITAGGGELASEVDVDGETLYVLVADDQDNGLIRATCVRESI